MRSKLVKIKRSILVNFILTLSQIVLISIFVLQSVRIFFYIFLHCFLYILCFQAPISFLEPYMLYSSFFQFSAFQNTFYPLTDRFLYSLIKRFRKISQDAHPLLRIFYLYQHDGDTFFLNTSSIDKYNMPL